MRHHVGQREVAPFERERRAQAGPDLSIAIMGKPGSVVVERFERAFPAAPRKVLGAANVSWRVPGKPEPVAFRIMP